MARNFPPANVVGGPHESLDVHAVCTSQTVSVGALLVVATGAFVAPLAAGTIATSQTGLVGIAVTPVTTSAVTNTAADVVTVQSLRGRRVELALHSAAASAAAYVAFTPTQALVGGIYTLEVMTSPARMLVVNASIAATASASLHAKIVGFRENTDTYPIAICEIGPDGNVL